jgi:hypothetical protein
MRYFILLFSIILVTLSIFLSVQNDQRLKYNNPDFVFDLQAAIWTCTLPCDYYHGGDMDLLGGAENGCFYYFKNPLTQK